MASALRLQLAATQKVRPILIGIRQISTSKKNRETITVSEATKQESKTEVTPVNKNWVTYGFDRLDETRDRRALHLTFFGGITMCLVFGSFYLWYAPDVNLKDWAQREAFLELRRREKAGGPLVDANLISPSKIQLPSDEELGNTDIII